MYIYGAAVVLLTLSPFICSGTGSTSGNDVWKMNIKEMVLECNSGPIKDFLEHDGTFWEASSKTEFKEKFLRFLFAESLKSAIQGHVLKDLQDEDLLNILNENGCSTNINDVHRFLIAKGTINSTKYLSHTVDGKLINSHCIMDTLEHFTDFHKARWEHKENGRASYSHKIRTVPYTLTAPSDYATPDGDQVLLDFTISCHCEDINCSFPETPQYLVILLPGGPLCPIGTSNEIEDILANELGPENVLFFDLSHRGRLSSEVTDIQLIEYLTTGRWTSKMNPAHVSTKNAAHDAAYLAKYFQQLYKDNGVEPKLWIYGFSYGAQLALKAVELHPDMFEKAIVMGFLGYEILGVNSTLKGILELCEGNVYCRKVFGENPSDEIIRLYEEFVNVGDNECKKEFFDRTTLQFVPDKEQDFSERNLQNRIEMRDMLFFSLAHTHRAFGSMPHTIIASIYFLKATSDCGDIKSFGKKILDPIIYTTTKPWLLQFSRNAVIARKLQNLTKTDEFVYHERILDELEKFEYSPLNKEKIEKLKIEFEVIKALRAQIIPQCDEELDYQDGLKEVKNDNPFYDKKDYPERSSEESEQAFMKLQRLFLEYEQMTGKKFSNKIEEALGEFENSCSENRELCDEYKSFKRINETFKRKRYHENVVRLNEECNEERKSRQFSWLADGYSACKALTELREYKKSKPESETKKEISLFNFIIFGSLIESTSEENYRSIEKGKGDFLLLLQWKNFKKYLPRLLKDGWTPTVIDHIRSSSTEITVVQSRYDLKTTVEPAWYYFVHYIHGYKNWVLFNDLEHGSAYEFGDNSHLKSLFKFLVKGEKSDLDVLRNEIVQLNEQTRGNYDIEPHDFLNKQIRTNEDEEPSRTYRSYQHSRLNKRDWQMLSEIHVCYPDESEFMNKENCIAIYLTDVEAE